MLLSAGRFRMRFIVAAAAAARRAELGWDGGSFVKGTDGEKVKKKSIESLSALTHTPIYRCLTYFVQKHIRYIVKLYRFPP